MMSAQNDKIQFAGKIGSSNVSPNTGFAILDVFDIAGHNVVADLTELYGLSAYKQRLSVNGREGDGSDAIGWTCYVTDSDGQGNGCYAKLIDWGNLGNSAGWQLFDIFTLADKQKFRVGMTYRGEVSGYSNLPASNNSVGDTYRILSDYSFTEDDTPKCFLAGTCFTWGGQSWKSLGAPVEIITEADIDNFNDVASTND